MAKSKPKMKLTKKPTLKPLKAANKKAASKKGVAKKGSAKAASQKAAPKKTLKAVAKKSAGTQKMKTALSKKMAVRTPVSKTTPKTTAMKQTGAKSQTNFRNFLSPLENRLFVKVIEEPRKTASGLFIPDTARLNDSYVRGEVLAVGPGRKDKHGKLHRVGVDIGETVILTEHAGTTILLEGQNFIFVRESDIVGVLE